MHHELENAARTLPNPKATVINPSWPTVDQAKIFLMSLSNIAKIEEIKTVIKPIAKTKGKIPEAKNNGNNLRPIKIPAFTIVAECNSADTGVGPSIAQPSQAKSGNCADLAIMPPK